MVDPIVEEWMSRRYDGVMDEHRLSTIAKAVAAQRTLEVWLDLLREEPDDTSSTHLAAALEESWASLTEIYERHGVAIRKAALESIRR